MNLALASSQIPAHWQFKNAQHALACQALVKLLPSYLASLDSDRSGDAERNLATRFGVAVSLVGVAWHEGPAQPPPVNQADARRLLVLADLARVLREQFDALEDARGMIEQRRWTERVIATKVELQNLLGGRR